MSDYKKISIYLNDDLYNDVLNMVEYRNRRIIIDNEDKKVCSVEEFVTGSLIQTLKWIKSEDSLAGYDDLGKPFRLKNRFKELMIKQKLKQKDVSEGTKILPSNISIIFNNDSQPSLDYFLRLWVFFGSPPLNEVLYREE